MDLSKTGVLTVASIKEYSYFPLNTNWTDWVSGTTGSQGSFGAISGAESVMEQGTDPWGKTITLWACYPDAVSNADGGWNHALIPIDSTKTYRMSCWIKRTGTVDGTSYLGSYCYNSSSTNVGFYRRDTGAGPITNLYFYASDPTLNQWELWVGHIWPAGTGTGDEHPDSGRYTINGRIGNISVDFIQHATSYYLRHRVYFYYCVTTTNRQYMCYPRFDLCDGSEPSISALLAGVESNNYEWLQDTDGEGTISVSDSEIMTAPKFSEQGSLTGNTKMRQTDTGIVYVNEFIEG